MDFDEKRGRLVMIVEREALFSQKYFTGFLPLTEIDYTPLILNNYEYRKRTDVEEDKRFKQPIPYTVIVNKKLGKIFSHFRNGGDPRLQGFWTAGIMEHIEPVDELIGNPIYNGCLRGIKEETDLKNPNPKLIGWINVDEDHINQVHFGIFYILETDSEKISLRDKKLSSGKFVELDELKRINSSKTEKMEFWAPLCFNYLKSYLEGP